MILQDRPEINLYILMGGHHKQKGWGKHLFLSRYLALRKTSSALGSELWWTP
jgi:hypothetical protein